MWFNLSAAKGNHDAVRYREAIAERMSPSQIAEAQKTTREYVPDARQSRSSSSGSNVKKSPSTLDKNHGQQITTATTSDKIIVEMKNDGGVFVVPVEINNAITLDFVIDSGASSVSVPADVVSTLIRTHTIQGSDFIGKQTFVLADGSEVPSTVFTIRSLKVGDHLVENVRGMVAPAKGNLLLGQSFLQKFRSWSIDNTKHALVLE